MCKFFSSLIFLSLSHVMNSKANHVFAPRHFLFHWIVPKFCLIEAVGEKVPFDISSFLLAKLLCTPLFVFAVNELGTMTAILGGTMERQVLVEGFICLGLLGSSCTS